MPHHGCEQRGVRLNDPIAWGRHVACCWSSCTGQSPRHPPSLDHHPVVLSSRPSPAKSPWFLLPIGCLQHLRSRPRGGLVESASGLYLHLWHLIWATSMHDIRCQVLNGGQRVSGGYQMIVTLNMHWECWIYHQGWCNAVAGEEGVSKILDIVSKVGRQDKYISGLGGVFLIWRHHHGCYLGRKWFICLI